MFKNLTYIAQPEPKPYPDLMQPTLQKMCHECEWTQLSYDDDVHCPICGAYMIEVDTLPSAAEDVTELTFDEDDGIEFENLEPFNFDEDEIDENGVKWVELEDGVLQREVNAVYRCDFCDKIWHKEDVFTKPIINLASNTEVRIHDEILCPECFSQTHAISFQEANALIADHNYTIGRLLNWDMIFEESE